MAPFGKTILAGHAVPAGGLEAMKSKVFISNWAMCCVVAMACVRASASSGPPASPIGETDIAVGARKASVVVPPGTLVRLIPPNDRPELNLSLIAFFVDTQQRQSLNLMPSDHLPNFEFRVPDHGPKKYNLSIMGMDEMRKQTPVQTVLVEVDPAAVCHGIVTPINSMEAGLSVIGEHITAAYVFADNQYIGKAALLGETPTLSLAKLSPGKTALTIIAEDEYKNLYCPCKATVDVQPRFKISLSQSMVTVDPRGGSVIASVEPQADAAAKVDKIRFLLGTTPIAIVDGSTAKQTISLVDFGTGKYALGVQGLTKDGELMGMETVSLEVKNPDTDQRLAGRSLQQKLDRWLRAIATDR